MLRPAAVLLLAGALCAPAAAFLELTSTKCNLDPRRGEVADPCASLYDAECGGRWCRCPPGTIIHEGLRRCVPGGLGLTLGGRAGGLDRMMSDAQAEWEDIPHDFEDEDGDTPTTGVAVGGKCSRSKPCVEGAKCSKEGHCVCPEGTKSNPTKSGCDGTKSGSPAGEDDDSSAAVSPTVLPAALLSALLLAAAA